MCDVCLRLMCCKSVFKTCWVLLLSSPSSVVYVASLSCPQLAEFPAVNERPRGSAAPLPGSRKRPQHVVSNLAPLQVCPQLVGIDYSTVIPPCQSFPTLLEPRFVLIFLGFRQTSKKKSKCHKMQPTSSQTPRHRSRIETPCCRETSSRRCRLRPEIYGRPPVWRKWITV
ncbi:MAG: hypothetical protein RI954_285 [Actinomycetota bacterium]